MLNKTVENWHVGVGSLGIITATKRRNQISHQQHSLSKSNSRCTTISLLSRYIMFLPAKCYLYSCLNQLNMKFHIWPSASSTLISPFLFCIIYYKKDFPNWTTSKSSFNFLPEASETFNYLSMTIIWTTHSEKHYGSNETVCVHWIKKMDADTWAHRYGRQCSTANWSTVYEKMKKKTHWHIEEERQ